MTEAAAMYGYVNMILLSVIGGAFVVCLALLSWWAKDVHSKLTTVTDSAATMEEWCKAHDKQDDSRHEENLKRFDRNHISTHELRNQLSDFALKVGIQTRRINKRDDDMGIGS